MHVGLLVVISGCFEPLMHNHISFLSLKTFEAKLLHLESRAARRCKKMSTDELEFFMKCEVHSSDTDTFINALRRVAEEVRLLQDDRGA